MLNGLPPFDLLEALRWQPGDGFYLLDYHLERLTYSAQYFQFKLDIAGLTAALHEFSDRREQAALKVRVILSRCGAFAIESSPLGSLEGSVIGLARQPLPEPTPFIHHKTTRRQVYIDLLRDHCHSNLAVNDLVLWNQAGFVTESLIANVVIEIGGHLYTPPLQHGLLPGVFRRMLLEQRVIQEKSISIAQLREAQSIHLINSVRGWMSLRPFERGDIWTIAHSSLHAPRRI